MATQPPTPPAEPKQLAVPGNVYPRPGQPDPAIYVGFNDYLQVSSVAASAFPNIAIMHARLIRTDGQIVQLELYINGPSQLYQQVTQRLALCEGWLISVAVTSLLPFQERGTLYASVSLVRSTGSSYVPSSVLFADYITRSTAVGWPGGRIIDGTEGTGWRQTYSIGGPPAGSEWSWQVLSNTRVRVLSVGATLITAAGGSARVPRLTINGAAADLWFVAPGFTVPASSSAIISWLPGCGGLLNSAPAYTLPLPDGLTMNAIYSIGTSTTNLGASDTWGNIYVDVEQWMDPT